MSRRKKKLGKWQIAVLQKIAKHETCCHFNVLGNLKGLAFKWSYKYKRNLKRAIEAHNNGSAINSPIDPFFIIREDPHGGFKLVPR